MLRILNIEPDNYSRKAYRVLQTVGTVDERPLAQMQLGQYSSPRHQLLALISNYDVLITRLGFYIDADIIAAGTRLKAIVTATTGLDHIDLAAAAQHGVAVLSLRGEETFLRTVPATAEHTWGLLLALVRHIPQAFTAVSQGEWDRDQFRGRDLFGKRLGIVGLGRIGQIVARYGTTFGMIVQAYDPYLDTWPPTVTQMPTLDELLTTSEIVTIHIPLNDNTTNLIGEHEFKQMQPGAWLINTSRGAIINEVALLKALQSNHLGGAALDVLTAETTGTITTSHPLIRYAQTHTNLLLTPHIGGCTADSMAMTEIFMAKKLQKLFAE
ncbi:MAG: NAD(P)-dependent oxidoreductase [Chloroflexota bacterium]